ncbi:hypothetical protein IJ00_07340 [Calothrix sp. 336/3]|nr:hypothetical protein IJ00_07340 [Calothrix sp. 336/3]
MQCIAITEFEPVEKIKSNWNTVYNADPNCHIFSSWDWISGWLEAKDSSWIVLAVKLDDQESYIAFLPMLLKKDLKYTI